MRIAITVDPYIPVPPDHYGGIERIVDFLVRGLMKRGHQVTLFAHPGSTVEAALVSYGYPPHLGLHARATELWQLGHLLWKRRRDFDLIHSFGRLAALLPVLPDRALAKVQSYQRLIPWRSVGIAARLGGPSMYLTACSASMLGGRTNGYQCRTIFNGVDIAKYECVPWVPPEAPLIVLGRIERIKGTHNAIAIAKLARRRLVIAGNKVPGPEGEEYFRRYIEPAIDKEGITYVGPVNDERKNVLLGSGAALLMPIEWEEPFGIVMAEALACGTPVIGFGRGSVSEVVRDGMTGFVCHTVQEAAASVARLGEIDRRAARADCEERFSDTAVVDAYERLYVQMVGSS
jgi:glycosyltransferase involved in cell wall biosynthesis